MSKINPKDKYIHFTAGTASKIKDGEKVPVLKQPYQDPDCGCGIDCCYGLFVLPNISSTTGEVINYIAHYYVDGARVEKELSLAKAEILGYRNLQ